MKPMTALRKKNRLNRLQMDFSAPFCFQVTKLRKEDKNGFFFCIKKEHFSMYLHVKQCAIENEVNLRSRCCMFANNSKLHMHYLTLEPNSLKNRIFGIYIFCWTAISIGLFFIFLYKFRKHFISEKTSHYTLKMY